MNEKSDTKTSLRDKLATTHGVKHVDSSTYSRKTGSVLASDLKTTSHNENVSTQNLLKAHLKNSPYFSSSDSVSYTGKMFFI